MGAPFHPRGTCSRLPAASESLPIGKAARGNRSIVGSGEDKLTEVQFAELRRKLSLVSVTAVMGAYRGAYFQCKLEGDRIPSARAIQTLAQAWKEMRGSSKRR